MPDIAGRAPITQACRSDEHFVPKSADVQGILANHYGHQGILQHGRDDTHIHRTAPP